MNKENLRQIIYIIMSILLSILAIKLFIWLLPIILIAILAIFIYNSLRKEKRVYKKETKTNKKKIIIIDEEDIK